jgi:sec-independent protein translocase protein TatC
MSLRLLPRDRPAKEPSIEERQDLSEHLSELRVRIIRGAIYVVIGMIVMYAIFPRLIGTLEAPIIEALRQIAAKRPPDQRQLIGSFVFHSFFEPFFLRLQISLISGIVVAAPFITAEVWGFVLPALTPKERSGAQVMGAFTVFLFLLGGGLAYFIMPQAVHWFLLYLGDYPGAILLQDPQDYILFLVKMVLAFGLVFQLPVVMMALAKFGVIRSSMLIKYWRYIIVGITTAAMIITPSNDPFSMIVMAVPLVILFFISIWLVKLVEPNQDQPGR